ncbi:hypothetical protein [Desulfobacter postgatei]|uniref:hypothetical protein n=1 Tax=Desulfobacter postgatei TaxID=2293 RepID=UPI00259B5642|nr:hypothetical protein [uncultured Desulfobacter sp.]
MRYLEKIEVEEIVAKGRASSEQEITEMLDALEEKHPYIYQFIFGEPSDGIAMINMDMANLYLDLSCDVIWVFNTVFGRLPELKNEEDCVLGHLSKIDAELKSITEEIRMDQKFRTKLQKRFVKQSLESKIQLNLLQYLESEVVKYASFKSARKKAISITNNLLFVLVRLLGDLYYSVQIKDA